VLEVDRQAEEAVYLQIARQIRSAIGAGSLPSGAPLPSVRSLASDLGLNLNTVARAYRMLEGEGFVEIRNRTGAIVAPPAPRAHPETKESLRQRLAEVLALMRQAGMRPEQVEMLVAREIAVLGGDDDGSR
jgi:DNA-binding transcriptional regulator YhcF (GntR family)